MMKHPAIPTKNAKKVMPFVVMIKARVLVSFSSFPLCVRSFVFWIGYSVIIGDHQGGEGRAALSQTLPFDELVVVKENMEYISRALQQAFRSIDAIISG